ncbi:MAG TPA: pyridoxamine 5'-phosphate oxidase family protein [Gammaproteobacteria bacterium]|nr:pyridoxamine 5'-phosphate oxidase family protein [Gammaproteobacteria bacterium]|tara:strand:+ start:553 stop:1203 length:651 start_codon:yes stop_codon:yes gene_type:complete
MTRPSAPSARSKVRRVRELARYDRSSINAILDEATVCHVGFVDDGQPFVIPTAIARIDDHAYIHGSRVSRMLQLLVAGNPACITVTLLDGIVVARSAFNSSMNYRSVVILGSGEKVIGEDKKIVLDAFTEHLIPGRTADIRASRPKELAATTVVRFSLDEASVKISEGPPSDEKSDYESDAWAGVIPLRLKSGKPQPDPRLKSSIPVPTYISKRKT